MVLTGGKERKYLQFLYSNTSRSFVSIWLGYRSRGERRDLMPRFLGFCASWVPFPVLTWYFMNESPFTWRTIACFFGLLYSGVPDVDIGAIAPIFSKALSLWCKRFLFPKLVLLLGDSHMDFQTLVNRFQKNVLNEEEQQVDEFTQKSRKIAASIWHGATRSSSAFVFLPIFLKILMICGLLLSSEDVAEFATDMFKRIVDDLGWQPDFSTKMVQQKRLYAADGGGI